MEETVTDQRFWGKNQAQGELFIQGGEREVRAAPGLGRRDTGHLMKKQGRDSSCEEKQVQGHREVRERQVG